jgi:muramoyltetrapeptide carboxypeptidase
MIFQKSPHLNIGDTIAIISPSYGLMPEFRENYNKGKKELLKMGFNIKEGKTNSLIKWWSGGTPEQQAEDINTMFADSKVKAIIAQNGGHSAMSVLPHIDFQIIKNNPKPFIGFSDITIYHLTFLKETGLVGFHMDAVTYGLGWQWSVNDKRQEYYDLFNNILINPQALGIVKQKTDWQSWRSGIAEGKLIGGNLNVMSYLVGTKYFPNDYFKDAIFFWEADGANLARIAKELYQLKHAGLIDQIKGMIIGKIVSVPQIGFGIKEPTNRELILDIFKEYNFPILAEVDFGHETPNIPMPIGIMAKINADNLEYELLESVTT